MLHAVGKVDVVIVVVEVVVVVVVVVVNIVLVDVVVFVVDVVTVVEVHTTARSKLHGEYTTADWNAPCKGYHISEAVNGALKGALRRAMAWDWKQPGTRAALNKLALVAYPDRGDGSAHIYPLGSARLAPYMGVSQIWKF